MSGAYECLLRSKPTVLSEAYSRISEEGVPPGLPRRCWVLPLSPGHVEGGGGEGAQGLTDTGLLAAEDQIRMVLGHPSCSSPRAAAVGDLSPLSPPRSEKVALATPQETARDVPDTPFESSSKGEGRTLLGNGLANRLSGPEKAPPTPSPSLGSLRVEGFRV